MQANRFVSRDPRDGQVFAERPSWQRHDTRQALTAATQAAARWASSTLAQRAALLRALGEALLLASPALADSIQREMGKQYVEAEDEVLRAAKWCQFLAEQGPAWLAPEPGAHGQIWRRPLGVVLAVTPWNYPVWQIFRPLAAALLAGNAVLIKPAPNVAQTSALVEMICRELLPAGLMQCLWTDEVGTREALADPAVSMLVCTGSEITGRQLGALAAHHLKPAVLELGGNNAFIVLADADIEAAAEAAAQSRCLNAGQACTAAKRFIVVEAVANAFRHALRKALAHYQCGSTLAPLARADLRDKLARQVSLSVEQGARCLLGGQQAGGRGYYFPATLLEQVAPGMPAFDEELFGPVACLSVVADSAAAIALANASSQQLAASLWTRDTAQAAPLAAQLQAGMLCLNSRPTSRFALPFAGSQASGFGSTLGRDGLLAFTRPVAWLAG